MTTDATISSNLSIIYQMDAIKSNALDTLQRLNLDYEVISWDEYAKIITITVTKGQEEDWMERLGQFEDIAKVHEPAERTPQHN